MLLKADKDRIYDNLNTLNAFSSRPEQEGVARALFSEAEIRARSYVKKLMTQTGLLITEDVIGSIFGALVGGYPDLMPVWNGLYIDTIRNGGVYDRMVGVIGTVEACRIIEEDNIGHQRSITALVFTSEEPTRYKFGYIGGRALAGHLSLEETKDPVNESGISLYSELNRLGYTEMDCSKVVKKKGDVFVSIELHIEQASVLEKPNCPTGVVEVICAPTYINVVLGGQQEHVGPTPMNARHDAMTVVCEIMLKIESLTQSYGNSYTVVTVGRMLPPSNSSNVIAGRAEFSIGIRDISEDRKIDTIQKIYSYIDTIAVLRGLQTSHCVTADDSSHPSDKKIVAVIEESCTREGVFPGKMVSSTYHDSLFIVEFTSMEMILVSSRKGISHDPAEYTDVDDIVLGAEILIDTFLALSGSKEI